MQVLPRSDLDLDPNKRVRYETADALSEPKFQFVMNLKTANALGIAIPPLLLNQADKVIG
jgi:hypothetical protein